MNILFESSVFGDFSLPRLKGSSRYEVAHSILLPEQEHGSHKLSNRQPAALPGAAPRAFPAPLLRRLKQTLMVLFHVLHPTITDIVLEEMLAPQEQYESQPLLSPPEIKSFEYLEFLQRSD